MATRQRPTISKRQKERKREERKQRKAERLAQRRAERDTDLPPDTELPPEEVEAEEDDPDIAGIKPGPQALPWEE